MSVIKGSFINIVSIYYCWTFALDLAVLSKYAKFVPIFFHMKENKLIIKK